MNALIDQLLQGKETLLLRNPVLKLDRQSLIDACARLGASGSVLVSTSGTSSSNRWVILTRDSLRGSARAVNAHLDISEDDTWVCALPLFHVGGLAIYMRAEDSGSRVVTMEGKWDPVGLVDCCNKNRATLTSLVPTQLFDLLKSGRSAPSSLRAVIIGGAPLTPRLRDAALQKGWPVIASYGMTEAGSQIATQRHEGDGINLLECWDARVGNDSTLEIRGTNLFNGYLVQHSGNWKLVKPFDAEGWFSTGDRIELSGRVLNVLGRTDTVIKVLGEKVDVDCLQARVESIAGKHVAVIALTEERAGHQLVLLAEEGIDTVAVIDEYNGLSSGPERISSSYRVREIPRGALGKLRRNEVQKMMNSHGKDSPQLI
jgi:O-succinylbenzoic acid--CoA ligase